MRIPSRYTFSNLVKALRDPRRFLVEARRLALSVNAFYSRFRGIDDPWDVVEADWDTLVILDGCRYDLFEAVNTMEGRLESRNSVGSESWEFLQKTFQGRELHDTVYITANPYAPRLEAGTFFRMVNLLDTHWDPGLGTVHPEDMTDEALAVHREHPDKRLIVHFMQPHYPFIGENGQSISHAGIRPGDERENDAAPHVWVGLRDEKLNIDERTVVRAYRENLENTLPHVRALVESIDGKTVITADHGNLIGDRTGPLPAKGYGHPRGFYVDGLINVPWFVVESEKRRIITSDPPISDTDVDHAILERRLEDLGYR